MTKEQVFCGAEKCSPSCPAYNVDGFSLVETCEIVNSKIQANEAKTQAYTAMKEYYNSKITDNGK